MRHGIKKIKFKKGKDANDMLVRKMAVNFFLRGKIKTTLPKAKMIKPIVEKLVSKARTVSEANKNYLISSLGDRAVVKVLFDNIGPTINKINGGYVKIVKLGARLSDGSEVAELVWAYPVVNEKPKVEKVKKSASAEPASLAGGVKADK